MGLSLRGLRRSYIECVATPARQAEGDAEQFNFLAVPLMPGIHALSNVKNLRLAWAPAFAEVATHSLSLV